MQKVYSDMDMQNNTLKNVVFENNALPDVTAGKAVADSNGNNIPNTYINGVLQATDLNDITQSSVGTIVRACETASNQPVTGGGLVIQYYGGGGYYAQLFIANDADCTTWRRNNRAGTWTNWQKIISGNTPNFIQGTAGSIKLPSSGWYIIYGHYSFTGIIWWSPTDPTGAAITIGYSAVNADVAVATDGTISLIGRSDDTIFYYKLA